MNCSEIQILTSLYLSSELEASRLAEFEFHLQECRTCARDLEYVRHCDDLLRDAFIEQSVDTIKVRRNVRNEIGARRRRFLFGRPIYSLPIAAGILITVTLVILSLFSGGVSQTVYAAAEDDHYVEVVQRDQRPWSETADEIRTLARLELGDPEIVDRLKVDGYQLKWGLEHCYLSNQRYMHLVYQGAGREISIFIRRKDAELPGAPTEIVNGCPLHAAAVKQFEVAGFQSQKYTVLVVSDLPRPDSLRIARQAAETIE